MEDRIMVEREDGTTEEFVGGKDFIDAVARAASKEELRKVLNTGGVSGFDEEQLEESYKYLALSQDWEALMNLFNDKEFESCRKKLAVHGIEVTRGEFDLISEVVRSGSDDALIAEILHMEDVDSTLEAFRRHGYHAMTGDFLLLVQENARHFYEDAVLTQEDLREMSGKDFYERCRKSVNLIFALSTIAGLALGVNSVAEPALLLAIAGGVSLMYGDNNFSE